MTPNEVQLKAALKLSREWLIEFAPAGHDDRCQRLRDTGIPGCRCTFDVFQADLKVIDAAFFAVNHEEGDLP